MTVPRIKFSVTENNLHDLIREIRPNWIEEHNKNGVELITKVFSKGITNKLFGVRLATAPEKELLIVKVYGNKTELMIDRTAEIDTFVLLNQHKCGAQLYAVFDNGICYEYIPGVVLNLETCNDAAIYPLVAREMARLHKSIPVKAAPGESRRKSAIWQKLHTFYALNSDILGKNTQLREKLDKDFGYNLATLKNELEELEDILEKEQMPVVFCHNDTVLNNVIFNKDENCIRFIDYEYALPNYAPYDIANHFMEHCGLDQPDYSRSPRKEFRSAWIREYLNVFGVVEGTTQEQWKGWVELCIPLSDLYWALWCVIQTEISAIQFDFLGYAGLRYVKFRKHMEQIRNGTYQPL